MMRILMMVWAGLPRPGTPVNKSGNEIILNLSWPLFSSIFGFSPFNFLYLRMFLLGQPSLNPMGTFSTQVLAIIYHLIGVLFIQILERENFMDIPAYRLLCLGHWIGKRVRNTNRIAWEQSKVQECWMSPKAYHLRNHRRNNRGWP